MGWLRRTAGLLDIHILQDTPLKLNSGTVWVPTPALMQGYLFEEAAYTERMKKAQQQR